MIKLKELCKKKGMKAPDLIEKANIDLTPVQFSAITAGHVLPTPETLEKICYALGCTPADLWDDPCEYTYSSLRGKPERKKTMPRDDSNGLRALFDSLPPSNKRFAVRLPDDKRGKVLEKLRTMGYTSFGQYVRLKVVPGLIGENKEN